MTISNPITSALAVACGCTMAFAGVSGPAFPPPGGVTFSGVGIASSEGGREWSFSDHSPSVIASGLYYGKSSNGFIAVTLDSFDGDNSLPEPNEIMNFEGITGNEAVWVGESTIRIFDGAGSFVPTAVDTRFRMTATDSLGDPINFEDATAIDTDFPSSADAAIVINGDFSVNWSFEVSDDEGLTWQAVNTLFDNAQTPPPPQQGSRTRIWISTGYYVTGSCTPVDAVEPYGVLDLLDIVWFINGFQNGLSYADLDGNQIYDVTDLSLFVTAFLNGCP